MTYRQLLMKMQSMPDDRLDDDVTVFDGAESKFLPVIRTEIADDECDLDDGHWYLVINI